MAQENRAYQEMLSVAKNRLMGRDPFALAKKAGVTFSSSAFFVSSLGVSYKIDHPSLECSSGIEPWLHLLLLHYLDLADGYPVSYEPMPFGDIKDGVVRGVKFDRDVEIDLKRSLSSKTPDEIMDALKTMGADFIKSRADLCAVLSFFPNYPLILNIWYADDEFPASGKLFVTRSADHYLTIEDAVILGGLVLDAIDDKLRGIT